MKTIAVLFTTVLILGIASGASAEVKGFGLGAGVWDGEFGVQVRKDFWLGGDISQITAQGSLYFASKTVFSLDADYHFMVNPESSNRFYPLAGLNFAFNSDSAKFGLNAGGGMNFKLTATLNAFVEAKYVFSSWDGVAITGGIYF